MAWVLLALLALMVLVAKPAVAAEIDCVPGPEKNLSGCSFFAQNLASKNLSGSDLTGADLRQANLSSADLSNANLTYADLEGATISNANFQGAVLKGLYSRALQGNPAALPPGWTRLSSGHLAGPEANLTGAYLAAVDLRNLNLTGANLENADLRSAKVADLKLAGAKLRGLRSGGLIGTPSDLPAEWKTLGGFLVGPYVNLSGATLLSNLVDVNLFAANLKDTVFASSAQMTGVSSGSIQGVPKMLPQGWRIVNGYLVGPGARLVMANLKGANLNECDLSSADLSGADLTSSRLLRANLSSSNLDGVESGNISGTPTSLPPSWELREGYLIGPTANLNLRNLTGKNFSNADLSRATLKGAILDNVNLNNSNLSAADLQEARGSKLSVSGTDFTNARLSSPSFTELLGVPSSLPSGWVIETNNLVRASSPLPLFELKGASQTGSELSIDPEILSRFPSASIEWYVDNILVLGENLGTYIPKPEDLGKAVVAKLTLKKTGWQTSIGVSQARVVSQGLISPPEIKVLGEPKVDSLLRAEMVGEIDDLTISFQWLRNSSPIPGATDETFALTPQDASARIGLRVSMSKSGYATLSIEATEVFVSKGTQKITIKPDLLGRSVVGQSLEAKPEITPSEGNYTIRWFKNNELAQGITGSKYNLTSLDFGASIFYEVTNDKDGYEPIRVKSMAVLVTQGSMKPSTPKLSGQAAVGSTLRATVSKWTPGAAIRYQWLSNGKAISGATSSSLKVQKTMKGKRISLRVTQTALGYTTTSASSSSVVVK